MFYKRCAILLIDKRQKSRQKKGIHWLREASAGTAGAYRRHPAALRRTGGLRAGGGTDGLGRRVRPLSDGGGAGGERTPHEGLSVGKGSAGGSIGGIGCSHKPLGAVKGCCFPLWRTKNGTRIGRVPFFTGCRRLKIQAAAALICGPCRRGCPPPWGHGTSWR